MAIAAGGVEGLPPIPYTSVSRNDLDMAGLTMTRSAVLVVGFVVALGSAVEPASAQQAAPKIWDVMLGAHVSELPVDEFVIPSCGSNGGPQGLSVGSFDQFAKCPEEASGLREIWFRYDDQLEYEARARRDRALALRYSRNQELGQPLVLSLLIDRGGIVQGYRVVTDSRAETDVRRLASTLVVYFKGRFGLDGWQCEDIPQEAGEQPIAGRFIKERCEKALEGRNIVVESHQYYKPGQALQDPRTGKLMEGEFHSSARIEVIKADAIDAGIGD